MRAGFNAGFKMGAAAVLAAVLAAPIAARAAPSSRVWTSDIHDPEDQPRGGAPAITLVGAKNGAFSGKVVVGSGKGVKAKLSRLRAGRAELPTSCVLLRYGVPWEGKLAGGSNAVGGDILLESPPADSGLGRVPVWVTVRVPKGARPGTYRGKLTVEASGVPRVQVPVELEVADWTLPDPDDRRTWVEILQSPDTLSVEYGTEPWSEQHFALIARSLRFLGEIGSRVLYLPLIAHTNVGNETSMVRWVNKRGGRYEFEFSILEKYLDAAEKNMGKPKAVIFNVWDRYLMRPGAGGRDFQLKSGLRVATAGPLVTLWNPATGKTRNVLLPDYPPRASATVTLERLRQTTTAGEHLRKHLEELKKDLVDFKAQRQGSAMIDGQEARWVEFSCRMGPFSEKARVYVLLKGGRAAIITCLGQPEKFNRDRAVFEKIAGSFKLEDKNLTLQCPEGWEKAEFQYRGAGVGWGVVAVVWGPKDAPGERSPVREAWRSLFSQLRKRMKKRGLEQAMLLGTVSDFWATREQTEFLKEVSGDLPWANASHYYRASLWDGLARCGFHVFYFGVRFGYKESKQGWRRPDITAAFERGFMLDGWPVTRWRRMGEYCITGNVRGIGRLGADTWNVFKDKRGRRKGRVWKRYPESDWGYLNVCSSTLAPGPKGPVATARYEVLREGLQECEARIVVERALSLPVSGLLRQVSKRETRILAEQARADAGLRGRLGGNLVKRCEAALAERQQALWKSLGAEGAKAGSSPKWRKKPSQEGHAWFVKSNWQELSRRLYRLAGEVEKRVGKRR